MTRPLYTPEGRYTPEAVEIDREVGDFLDALLARHPDRSPRELGALCHAAVEDAVAARVLGTSEGDGGPPR